MSGYSPRFGVSAGFKPDATPREFAAKLGEFGFTALEVNAPYVERHGEALADLAAGFEALTFHLPHDAAHKVLSADPAADDEIFEKLRAHLARGARIGARTFVLHLSNIVGQRLEEYWGRSADFARRMGDVAAAHGSVVGVENCYPVVRYGPVARRFLDEVDHPAVGLTLDGGHFWSALSEDEYGRHKDHDLTGTAEGARILNDRLVEMAREAAPRIVNLHLHNLRPDDWYDHQPLGSGVMDYGPFFDELRRAGYDRTGIVEIRPTGGTWEGFERSAEYLQRFMPGRGM